MKTCGSCRMSFPVWLAIDGKRRNLSNRRFCLGCSPWLGHNTATSAPGTGDLAALPDIRQQRRRARWVRRSRDLRRALKAAAVAARGGRCIDCGYERSIAALEFHHRDPRTKKFGIGAFTSSRERLNLELEKCDLVCANCHRVRHDRVARNTSPSHELRRALKLQAIKWMGGDCMGCGRRGLPSQSEFHHRDPATKEFGISAKGVIRAWPEMESELAKCVLLCANCHREVHAGVRELFDDGLLGLAEDATPYRYEIARTVA